MVSKGLFIFLFLYLDLEGLATLNSRCKVRSRKAFKMIEYSDFKCKVNKNKTRTTTLKKGTITEQEYVKEMELLYLYHFF